MSKVVVDVLLLAINVFVFHISFDLTAVTSNKIIKVLKVTFAVATQYEAGNLVGSIF